MFRRGQPPFGPSHQPHDGETWDWSPERMRGVRGQEGPAVMARQATQQGRWLAGVDNMDHGRQEQQYDLDGTDEVYALEQLDDVLGSGIFDGNRRPATSNADTGVFASHYSLPGYLAREVPFQVSRELVSLPSGAETVPVPAGGMAYVERQGRLSRPLQTGPVPRLPVRNMNAEHGRLATYANVYDYPTENAGPGEAPGLGAVALNVPRRAAYPSSYAVESETPGTMPRVALTQREGGAALLPPSSQQVRPTVELPRYFEPAAAPAPTPSRQAPTYFEPKASYDVPSPMAVDAPSSYQPSARYDVPSSSVAMQPSYQAPMVAEAPIALPMVADAAPTPFSPRAVPSVSDARPTAPQAGPYARVPQSTVMPTQPAISDRMPMRPGQASPHPLRQHPVFAEAHRAEARGDFRRLAQLAPVRQHVEKQIALSTPRPAPYSYGLLKQAGRRSLVPTTMSGLGVSEPGSWTVADYLAAGFIATAAVALFWGPAKRMVGG